MLEGVPLPELEVLEIQGRRFRPTPDDEIVFQQYAMIQEASERCGLGAELMETFRPFIEAREAGAEMSEDDIAKLSQRAVVRAFRNGAYLDLLGGLLQEEGKPWTPEGAAANIEFFKTARGGDIPKLHMVLVYALLAFFAAGLRSMKTSLTFSKLETPEVTLRPKEAPAGAGATGASEG